MWLFADDPGPSPTTLLGILGVMATGIAGLLGVVVKWLLGHITELTKQLTDQGKAFADAMAKVVDSRDAAMKDTRADFKEALRSVTEHCEREIARQIEIGRERDDKVDKALTDLREVLETVRDWMIRSAKQ